jgi:arsenical pump membrane protein
MSLAPAAHVATWSIAALSVVGVIVRPWRIPEALWAVLGAGALALFALIPLPAALAAIHKGTDVYLFLTGMMLLAELAREAGLFDWLAAYATRKAAGSATRLFILIYAVGIVVTVLLSNDATAVVLTPAVYAATRRAKADPLPYLFICAFIANAASFVLPISNPANLVVYGAHMPPLWSWLRQFGIASLFSIVATFLLLRCAQRGALAQTLERDVRLPRLDAGGRLAAAGIVMTAVVLLMASSRDWQLGLPTLLAGAGTGVVIMVWKRTAPWRIVKRISWSVLPLVAGLFVLVQGVEDTGVLQPLIHALSSSARSSPDGTALVAGGLAALLCNAMNNLPLGLIAAAVTTAAQLAPQVSAAILIGVDLGPNLSITGSLATILWLVALRREGQEVSGWKFLLLGSIVMPPALLVALASFVWLQLH